MVKKVKGTKTRAERMRYYKGIKSFSSVPTKDGDEDSLEGTAKDPDRLPSTTDEDISDDIEDSAEKRPIPFSKKVSNHFKKNYKSYISSILIPLFVLILFYVITKIPSYMAKTEGAIENIKDDISDVKSDLKEIKNDQKSIKVDISKKFDKINDKIHSNEIAINDNVHQIDKINEKVEPLIKNQNSK